MGKFGRLRRSENSVGLGGQEIWETWRFGRRNDRRDTLAGNKCIFATSCGLCKLIR
jgi:hypothetical protein